MKVFLLIFLFLIASCLQEVISPEAALKEYVEARMNNTVTRQFVIDRVTGKMKQSFENMSEEDFQKFADLRNVKKDSFKILTKSCQEKKCFLTYSVSYKTTNAEASFHTEVKKIAEVVNLESKWLISDVSNIKTYHEALDPINPLD